MNALYLFFDLDNTKIYPRIKVVSIGEILILHCFGHYSFSWIFNRTLLLHLNKQASKIKVPIIGKSSQGIYVCQSYLRNKTLFYAESEVIVKGE